MSLPNLQSEFVEGLLGNQQVDFLQPAQNIKIYQNHVNTHLVEALITTYPLIAKLVGEDFFRIAAKEYIKRYPSRSGNLYDYGEYFSDFIVEYPPVKNLIYLAEVATFEWICHTLCFAADHAGLDPKVFENTAPEQYSQLHFNFHPASQIIKFHYPILEIIALCEGEVDDSINVNNGGINLLIIRRDLEIKLVALSDAEYVFLKALQTNSSLDEALEAALQISPDFNLLEKLPQWIQDKTLVDCYLLDI